MAEQLIRCQLDTLYATFKGVGGCLSCTSVDSHSLVFSILLYTVLIYASFDVVTIGVYVDSLQILVNCVILDDMQMMFTK